MAQEEFDQKFSNSTGGAAAGGGGSLSGGVGSSSAGEGGSGGGGSNTKSSKKQKQKRVPQRGLGVAQLERIRLEEEQKRDSALQQAGLLLPNSVISPGDHSCLGAQTSTFRHVLSPPPIPPHPSLLGDIPSPNSAFRSSRSVPNMSALHLNPVPYSRPLNIAGGEITRSAVPVAGLWNGDYNTGGENQMLDPHGLAFRYNLNLPYEPNVNVLPLPNVMQKSPQFLQNSSSMVNTPSGISSSSSSAFSYQLEPPSNQSYSGSNYSLSWPEEVKMLSLKRPYPFSLGDAPAPPFHRRFSPYDAPISGPDESAAYSNYYTVNLQEGSQIIRQGSTNSSMPPEVNPARLAKESEVLNGDLLTLAPPAAVSPQSAPKRQRFSVNSVPHQDLFGTASALVQGGTEGPTQWPSRSGSTEQPLVSFSQSAQVKVDQAENPASNCNEVEESIDLELKL